MLRRRRRAAASSINSAMLATIVGVCSTLLGLVLALVVQRGGQRYSGVAQG